MYPPLSLSLPWQIKESKTVERLREAMEPLAEYLEVAGCKREVQGTYEKYSLIDDVLNFHLMVRMQLPLQRYTKFLFSNLESSSI